MENLRESMLEILRKCKILEEFYSLHTKRDTIQPEIQKLKAKAEETEYQLNETLNIHTNGEIDNIYKRYFNLMQRMRKQQMRMLNLVIEIKKVKNQRKASSISFKLAEKEVVPGTPQSQLKPPGSAGRMYLHDYENSPFVSSKFRPKSLQFCDFDVHITTEMFDTIPKYMRGREQLDDLINFLDDVIIACFNDKYKLIFMKREFIKNVNDLQIWRMYKEQVSLYPNQKFITQGDMTRKLNKLIDQKMKAKINMLRHLGIIKEQHNSQTICYIWIAN